MKIAIRVDASQLIGTGHVQRCQALAHALRDLGADIRFLTRDLGVDTSASLLRQGFATTTLAAPDGNLPPAAGHGAWAGVPQAQDAKDTVEALHAWRPDWIVVDHYSFDAEWHDAVRQTLGCRIAAIDDLADRSLAVDLLIDHNYAADHRARYRGRIEDRTALLAGPRYALLGPAYAAAERHVLRAEVKSVGIFLGGVDRDNASAVALDAVVRTGIEGEVEIVTTSANPNIEVLRAAAATRPRTRVTVDLPDLASFFARHDIQIGAGGGASWERCCVGAPTLMLMLAENQRAVVPDLAAQGIVVTPEPLGSAEPAAIATSLQALITDARLREALSERARGLVDGQGARRVALRMLADRVEVRAATIDDAPSIFAWRNDPTTRSVSRTTQAIVWDEHVAWLERVLADDRRRLMIGIVDRTAVGVVRFDTLDDGRAEVSLYLDPTLHGLGLGRAMLLAGETEVADGIDIVAEVLDGNRGSVRLFDSAGYRRVDTSYWMKPAARRAKAKSRP